MKRYLTFLKPISLIGLTISLGYAQTALAEHPGKAFHDSANCISCHSATSKHPYNPQKSDTWPKLVKAVNFCNDNLNAGMFEDEVEQLADYLNQTYYKLPKE